MITICNSFSFATRLKARPSKNETICKAFSLMPTGYLAADGKDLGAFKAKVSNVNNMVAFGDFKKK